MSKSEALTTIEDAAEALGMEEAEMNAAFLAGDLRRVTHDGASFVLGADIDKALRDKDPRHLARLVLDGADPDDPESPKNLAADLPRL